MKSESWQEVSVRESRRRAMLAREIVEEHTGPLKKILGQTRHHPFLALGLALLAGLLAAIVLGRED